MERIAWGLDDPGTLHLSEHLTGFYRDWEPVLLECFDERLELLGEVHPDTLDSLYQVVRLHEALGRLAEAELAAGWLLELTPEHAAQYAEREELLERILEKRDRGDVEVSDDG